MKEFLQNRKAVIITAILLAVVVLCVTFYFALGIYKGADEPVFNFSAEDIRSATFWSIASIEFPSLVLQTPEEISRLVEYLNSIRYRSYEELERGIGGWSYGLRLRYNDGSYQWVTFDDGYVQTHHGTIVTEGEVRYKVLKSYTDPLMEVFR